MDDGQIRIEKIKASQLYEFACRIYNENRQGDVIPITKHRALAQAHNPYAGRDDIGLLVAYSGGRCIGYLGLLPGLLKAGLTLSKVYWMSSWFVLPEFRKRPAALTLMMSALSLRYELMASGMSRESELIYRALGFRRLGPLDYYAINTYRCNPLKRAFYGGIYKAGREEISYREVDKISEEAFGRVSNSPSVNSFYRGSRVINWMLQYRWIAEPDTAEPEDSGYYFSSVRDKFRYIAVEVYSADGKDYKGFAVFSISVKNPLTVFKVLDFGFLNQADYKYVLIIVFKYARGYLADRIEFPSALAGYARGGILKKFLLRRKELNYFCRPKDGNSPLARASNDIALNYCDGDIAFN